RSALEACRRAPLSFARPACTIAIPRSAWTAGLGDTLGFASDPAPGWPGAVARLRIAGQPARGLGLFPDQPQGPGPVRPPWCRPAAYRCLAAVACHPAPGQRSRAPAGGQPVLQSPVALRRRPRTVAAGRLL